MPGPESFQYLPNPAKCAIEYLDAQGYGNRTIKKLDAYIDHYFTATGQVCDQHTRFSCHHIAIRRFSLQGEEIEGAIPEALPEHLRSQSGE